MPERSSDLSPELARELRAYGALDSPARLHAYRIIHDSPDISFSELVRELDVASGLAAYHLGVLRAAGLVEVRYVRSGMATSEYVLTPLGGRIFDNLFGPRHGRLRRLAKSTSKVLA